MAEAQAARDGLQHARDCGYGKVMLEVDNLSLVNLLRSNDGIRSPIAGFWHEIGILGRSFTSFMARSFGWWLMAGAGLF
jgi:hypothetical protein